jgi:predicted DNA binding protein
MHAGLTRMMHIVDDFRALPRAEFELTLTHKGCWAGKLSKASGQELAIDPVVQKGKSLVVLVLMSKGASLKALAELKQAGEIGNYEKLQEPAQKIVCRVEVDEKKSILQSIADHYFELLSPVTVSDETEKYHFGTLDISRADSNFSELISALKGKKGVSIESYKEREVQPARLTEHQRLTEQDHALIREIITTDYFNPDKKGRPKQEDLAKRLNMSTGKLNQMLRKLEYIGFQNLLIVKPDMAEFRALLREIEREDSRQDE